MRRSELRLAMDDVGKLKSGRASLLTTGCLTAEDEDERDEGSGQKR